MKRLALSFLVLSMIALPVMADGKRGRGHWKHHHGPPVAYYPVQPAYVAPPIYAAPPMYEAHGYGWFAPDIDYLRSCYRGRYFDPMPAGYILAPGRPIPPGLLRKMRPIPVYMERRLAPLPLGYSRGFIGGNFVLYNRNSSIAIDIASLF